MGNEIDLLNVVTLLRQSRFLGQTRLKDYQRQLIPNFRKYNIKLGDNELQDDGPFYEQKELESLAYFDPMNDPVDKMLWDELALERNRRTALKRSNTSSLILTSSIVSGLPLANEPPGTRPN